MAEPEDRGRTGSGLFRDRRLTDHAGKDDSHDVGGDEDAGIYPPAGRLVGLMGFGFIGLMKITDRILDFEEATEGYDEDHI